MGPEGKQSELLTVTCEECKTPMQQATISLSVSYNESSGNLIIIKLSAPGFRCPNPECRVVDVGLDGSIEFYRQAVAIAEKAGDFVTADRYTSSLNAGIAQRNHFADQEEFTG